MKATKIEANQVGKRYALVPEAGAFSAPRPDAFSVWAECTNYSSGRYVKQWRYCERGLTREEADALFARKVAGKSR